MIDAITVISYLLGNQLSHQQRLKLSAHFFENQHQPMCVGQVEFPSLRWKDVPTETASVAIIIRDGDSSGHNNKSHYYWVVYNLPADTLALPFGASKYMLPNHVGLNSWGEQKYHSRCWGDQVRPVSIELIALSGRVESDKPLSGDQLEHEIVKKHQVLERVTYHL